MYDLDRPTCNNNMKKRRMMYNISKCTRCNVKNCSYWYKDKFTLKDSSMCTSFQEFDVFKQPLLIHLISDNRKAQAVNDILQSVHLKLKETNSYPYFHIHFHIKGDQTQSLSLATLRWAYIYIYKRRYVPPTDYKSFSEMEYVSGFIVLINEAYVVMWIELSILFPSI